MRKPDKNLLIALSKRIIDGATMQDIKNLLIANGFSKEDADEYFEEPVRYATTECADCMNTPTAKFPPIGGAHSPTIVSSSHSEPEKKSLFQKLFGMGKP